jgi:hypothetical protein
VSASVERQSFGSGVAAAVGADDSASAERPAATIVLIFMAKTLRPQWPKDKVHFCDR